MRKNSKIIEPEAEVVDCIRSGNARTVNPPRPATLSARDLRPERENQLDSAKALTEHVIITIQSGPALPLLESPSFLLSESLFIT